MEQTRDDERPLAEGKKIVSRSEAGLLMVLTVLSAGVTTGFLVSEIAGYFTGPVTLDLPVSSSGQSADGLGLGSTGQYTTLAATIPALPSGPAVLLAWSSVLHQIGVLAVHLLVFLLAYRLRSAVLFTAGSVWIIGICGAVLTLAGTAGQVLSGFALPRITDLVVGEGRPAAGTILFEGELTSWPLVLGTILMLVAGVFQYGRRLQQDAEGLV